MADRELSEEERVSVARATQLIRDAGYRDKASLLNDMQQKKNIVIDPGLEPTIYASNAKGNAGDPEGNKIRLNSNKLKLLAGVLARLSPEIVVLAGTLLHEADHALCHDELDAFGEEVAFYATLNRDFAKLFPGATAAQKRDIEAKKKEVETEANNTYERIARRGGVGYGDGYKDTFKVVSPEVFEAVSRRGLAELVQVQMHPGDPSTAVTQHMQAIAERIYAYYERVGSFPPTGNAEMVRAIRESNAGAFELGELNGTGEVVDPWSQPYVYRTPGKWFPEFDLFSLGPGGADHDGGGDNILCELHRR